MAGGSELADERSCGLLKYLRANEKVGIEVPFPQMEGLQGVVGRAFALLRKAKGLSWAEIAEVRGVNSSSVGRLERKTANPRIGTILEQLDAMDATLEDLVRAMRAVAAGETELAETSTGGSRDLEQDVAWLIRELSSVRSTVNRQGTQLKSLRSDVKAGRDEYEQLRYEIGKKVLRDASRASKKKATRAAKKKSKRDPKP